MAHQMANNKVQWCNLYFYCRPIKKGERVVSKMTCPCKAETTVIAAGGEERYRKGNRQPLSAVKRVRPLASYAPTPRQQFSFSCCSVGQCIFSKGNNLCGSICSSREGSVALKSNGIFKKCFLKRNWCL